MITRYQYSPIEMLWSKENKAEIWKNIEIWVAEAWHQKGLITKEELSAIQEVQLNLEDWKLREQKTNHEMAAFVDMLSAQCGRAGRWIHYGLTSNDVLDSTMHYLLAETIKIFLQLLDSLLLAIKKHALAEKKTLMIGRTHGMFAEPISVGYKFALWYSELSRHQKTLKQSLEIISVCKIAGPTGIRADLPLQINEYVAQKMKMRVDYAVNQLILRDRLVTVVHCWSGLSLTLEKIAIEIRNLQRSEINEFQEPFFVGQKGSSAMPHKQNPWLSENICGLSRLFRNLAQSLTSTNLTWHERDLTNSAIERVAIPDLANLMGTMFVRLTKIIEGLTINYEQIKSNLIKGETAVFSHRALLFLIRTQKMTRDKAYVLIQKNAIKATRQKLSFRDLIQKDPVLKKVNSNEWKRLWDWNAFTENLDEIFERIFPKTN